MEHVEMKDRIAHIIRAKNLTAAEFALRLGIQPSNVSHLLSGRNNPSLEFVKKLKETFPEYNLDWIVMGTGPMTVSEPIVVPKSSMEQPVVVAKPSEHREDGLQGTLFAAEAKVDMPAPFKEPDPATKLKRIILVYSDDSFEMLSPR